MSLDRSVLLPLVASQLGTKGKIAAKMGAVIDELEKDHPHADWAKFRKLPYDRIAPMKKWLTHRFTEEPPTIPVKGLWFGLCHTKHGSKSADLYLSASSRFGGHDPAFRWARDAEYHPDDCYARSDALWKIYQAAHRKKGRLKETAERPLCFAYACLVMVKLLAELAEPRLLLGSSDSVGVAAGYTIGEALLLGRLSQEGFELTSDEARKLAESTLEPEPITGRDSFWNLIAELIEETGTLEDFEKRLEDELSRRPPEEAQAFARESRARLEETCNWDLYAAATNIGCVSEDAFLSFRRWTIYQGPRQYARIVRDPDYLGEYDPTAEPLEHWYSDYSPLHYLGSDEERSLSPFPKGESPYGSDQELAARFPKLWKRLRQ
ncbi:hypothetical protein Pan216_19660 [Planctomycetes bacterium Pan216]|uniref:DUF4240 domain-containing protein n=1 Tax=Kolteria novifilia TaxID=2527975 RepID=A0A518B2D7_9BACT|nr:hypothetical protein Pan216_19660 [Planctomycetes bacterium Pan216]